MRNGGGGKQQMLLVQVLLGVGSLDWTQGWFGSTSVTQLQNQIYATAGGVLHARRVS